MKAALRIFSMGRCLATAAIVAVSVLVLVPPAAADESLLEEHLINFIAARAPYDELEPSQLLYPLTKTPLLATTSYLVFADSPRQLERIYDDLATVVIERYEPRRLTRTGLMPGSPVPEGAKAIALSPVTNAFATLELYSLHLIAATLGKHEDAIEFIAASRKLADAVTQAFYNPSREFYFPLDDQGNYAISYRLEQTLPLLFERRLGEFMHRQVLQTMLFWIRTFGRHEQMPLLTRSMLFDPVSRPVIKELLFSIPWFSGEILAEFDDVTIRDEKLLPQPDPVHRHWTEFWESGPAAKRGLFPPWKTVTGLIQLVHILERESLIGEKQLARLRADTDTLTAASARYSLDFESYQGALSAANRLLSTLSELTALIETRAVDDTVLDAYKWKRISPRTRRLVTTACSIAPDEILRSKAELSNLFAAGTGITAQLHLPRHPVPIGAPADLTVSINSMIDTLTISRIYIQMGDARKKLFEEGDVVVVVPQEPTVIYDAPIPLPPTRPVGIWPLHIYLDFMLDKKRVEIHALESISLTKEYDIKLDFPMGRKLTGAEEYPLLITLRYVPDRDIRGSVKGSFFKELDIYPELPADFMIPEGHELTHLPITVTPSARAAPGTYPFSLSVELDGKTIGNFEDALVLPMRWFSLGPLSLSNFKSKGILTYQDSFHETFTSPAGQRIAWREVPDDAVDERGAVLPRRIYNRPASECFLLYTVVDAPRRMTVSWRLETANRSALWINSERVLTTENDYEDSFSGISELRDGFNSLLIASCRNEANDRLRFEFSDTNGLPIHGLTNDIDELISTLAGESPASRAADEEKDRLKRVTLSLDNPDAARVAVIGSFNTWDPDATPMDKNEGGVWEVTLFLSPGTYSYKFLIDGELKITDPASDNIEPDGFGGFNSILVVE
jgi:hypothetical protein